jgi:SAM-dependent MidA family methyltransferase
MSNNLLTEKIISKIKQDGPISFSDFMDMALYYPSLGYYTSPEKKIGRQGDYYTSPVLSELFGQMIAKQLEEMWQQLEKKPFTIVEYGAGTGIMCRDILHYLKKNEELYEQLTYVIIEISESMRQQQQRLLDEKVRWCDSITELSPINGCVLSNELLDNFPVHKVVMQEQLMEVLVAYQHSFTEVLSPATDALKKYFTEQQVDLPIGYSTEVNLLALDWIKEIAGHIASGFVLTIDYGFPSSELYNSKRNKGTMMCFKNHEMNHQPYDDVGKKDITVHVNFSALKHWGEKYGLHTVGYTTQGHFLRSLGLMNELRKFELQDPENNRDELLQIQRLLLDMGQKFKVLIQEKGAGRTSLTGMLFSSPLV